MERRRIMYAALGSLEEKRQDINAIINKINKNNIGLSDGHMLMTPSSISL